MFEQQSEKREKFYKSPEVKVENEQNAKYIFKKLEDIGFNQYEISNFAKDNEARCKHNIGYWNYTEYLGIGSGAVGTLGNHRTYGQKDPLKYIKTPLKYEQIEILKKEDVTTEKILLGLRSIVGIEYKLFTQEQQQKIEYLLEAKKVYLEDEKVYATDYMIADEIALYLSF